MIYYSYQSIELILTQLFSSWIYFEEHRNTINAEHNIVWENNNEIRNITHGTGGFFYFRLKLRLLSPDKRKVTVRRFGPQPRILDSVFLKRDNIPETKQKDYTKQIFKNVILYCNNRDWIHKS